MESGYVTAHNFETEVLKSEIPVLVDFYAEWCGPCKMISPVIDEIATELAGRVKVLKANVDDVQQIAARFQVMSIPNMILFKDGQVVQQLVGVMPKDQLRGKISEKL